MKTEYFHWMITHASGMLHVELCLTQVMHGWTQSHSTPLPLLTQSSCIISQGANCISSATNDNLAQSEVTGMLEVWLLRLSYKQPDCNKSMSGSVTECWVNVGPQCWGEMLPQGPHKVDWTLSQYQSPTLVSNIATMFIQCYPNVVVWLAFNTGQQH